MKPILLTLTLTACINLSAQVEQTSTGSNFSNSNLPGSSQSWINIGNAGISDDAYASFGNLPVTGNYTDYLVVTNFGFNLPAGIIITGIKADVECSDNNSLTADYSIRIVKQGVIGATELALGTAFEANDKNLTYGGATQLWGDTWSYTDINDNNFGFAIAVQRFAPGAVTAGQVDDISITVYYRMIALPVTLSSFTATKGNRSVVLNWNTATESAMDHYEIQRSSNGVNFYELGTVSSQNQQGSAYSYMDKTPLSGIVYYRLKMEGQAGYKKYSPVVSVHFDKHATISLTPCPWTKGNDLNINNPGKEIFRIQFYNANGQVISTVITSSDKVATDNLSNKEGKFYYNVFNMRNELLGSGTLIIQ
ncbi:MAG: hypothetical protein ABIR30_13070 [Chitinophagaceae bacterium]